MIPSRLPQSTSESVLTRTSGAALFVLMAALMVLSGVPLFADSSSTPPRLPGKVDIVQNLNAQLPLDTMFRDSDGRIVRLRQLFRGKPVLLNLMYYRCPMLCGVVMDGLTSMLTELRFNIGDEYDVITVSFDPRDTPEQAAEKKKIYIRHYGRHGAAAGWHFLTSNESAIRKLTDTVGFHYAYDPTVDQFAHGTVLLAVTPDGRVSRYFYGFEYKPRDVRLGLVEASENKIGNATDAVLLLCFHYDPRTGKYSRSAMTFVRAGGVATVFSLASFIIIMIRKEKKHDKEAEAGRDDQDAAS